MNTLAIYKAKTDSDGHIISLELENAMSQSDLTHFGILGMKWGIHRRGPAHLDSARVSTLKKKHITELSNEELKAAVNRMQLEKQFKDLSGASVGRGRGILTKMLLNIGAKAVNQYVASVNGDQSYTFFADAIRERMNNKKKV